MTTYTVGAIGTVENHSISIVLESKVKSMTRRLFIMKVVKRVLEPNDIHILKEQVKLELGNLQAKHGG